MYNWDLFCPSNTTWIPFQTFIAPLSPMNLYHFKSRVTNEMKFSSNLEHVRHDQCSKCYIQQLKSDFINTNYTTRYVVFHDNNTFWKYFICWKQIPIWTHMKNTSSIQMPILVMIGVAVKNSIDIPITQRVLCDIASPKISNCLPFWFAIEFPLFCN